jgi:hypothetical protein
MKNPSNPVHMTLPESQHRCSFDNIYMNRRHCLPDSFQSPLELHSPRLCATLLTYVPVILLNFLLYLLLYASIYIPQHHFINMEPTARQVRNHYSQKNQEAHLERALARAFKKTANSHCQSNV